MQTTINLFTVLILFITACNDTSDSNPIKETDSSPSSIVADSILQEKLEYIGMKDQMLRRLLPEVETIFGMNTEEDKYFWSLITEQDSVNLNEMVNIIDQYGWLGKSRVGEKANKALWLVIQHAPLETQEKYLPLLKNSVNKNESEGWHLAFLEDRVRIRNGQKQLYGSQASWDEATNQITIDEIEDFENINQRRTAIGMETIEEYAEKSGYLLKQ